MCSLLIPPQYISDQASCYEKYGWSVSSSLWDNVHFTNDSKDLWIAACTFNDQQHGMLLFQDLSQRTLSQLNKHNEELALQKVSDPVISTLESIFCFTETDIPELYKPWTSTSSNHSTLIGASLFIVINKMVLLFILMTIRLALITIDRHQSKEKHMQCPVDS